MGEGGSRRGARTGLLWRPWMPLAACRSLLQRAGGAWALAGHRGMAAPPTACLKVRHMFEVGQQQQLGPSTTHTIKQEILQHCGSAR